VDCAIKYVNMTQKANFWPFINEQELSLGLLFVRMTWTGRSGTICCLMLCSHRKEVTSALLVIAVTKDQASVSRQIVYRGFGQCIVEIFRIWRAQSLLWRTPFSEFDQLLSTAGLLRSVDDPFTYERTIVFSVAVLGKPWLREMNRFTFRYPMMCDCRNYMQGSILSTKRWIVEDFTKWTWEISKITEFDDAFILAAGARIRCCLYRI